MNTALKEAIREPGLCFVSGKHLSRDRFIEKVSPEPITGCFLWTGGVNDGNYGSFYDAEIGRMTGAHRAAYQMEHGAIPSGLHVLHQCDVPLCVNPAHLFLGTHAENMADMKQKGRRLGKGTRKRGKKAAAAVAKAVAATHATYLRKGSALASLTMDEAKSVIAMWDSGCSRDKVVAAFPSASRKSINRVLRAETWVMLPRKRLDPPPRPPKARRSS